MLQDYYLFKAWPKRAAAFLFDAAGSLFFLPLRRRRARFKPEAIRKVLLVRLDHLGDVIMTLPAAVRVRELFPQAELHWLIPLAYEKLLMRFAEQYQIRLIPFEFHWFARERIVPEIRRETRQILSLLRKEKYQLGIDFRGDLRNILLLWRAGIPFRAGYGATGGGFLLTHCPKHNRNEHPSALSRRLLESLGNSCELKPVPIVRSPQKMPGLDALRNSGKKIVAIHPGAAHAHKRWAADRFNSLIERILQEDLARVVLIGDARERREIRLSAAENMRDQGVLDERGQVPMHELPDLLSAVDLFIGNDSGPAHIAAAQGVPVISLFSTVHNPEAWKPWTDQLTLIAKPLSEITVDEVFAAASRTLAGRPA